MRIRTIKPEFFLHEGLFEAESALKLPLRLAFAGLWCAADREGRFKWEPRRLGVQILPYDAVDFSRVLDALASRGFIRKYASGTDVFGVIPSFTAHQVINNRERESELPEPPAIEQNQGLDACGTRELRDDDENTDTKSGREGKGREQGTGNKEGNGTGRAPSAWNPSPEQLIVSRWFHRRPTTAWTDKEIKAWNAIPSESIADGIDILAAPYLAGEKYCRRDLLTLLNNWQGEIDRWRSYKAAVSSDVQPAQSGYEDPPFLNDDEAIFHK